VRFPFRSWAVFMVFAFAAGSAPSAARAMICQQCGPFGGCEPGGAYIACWSGKFWDAPYCLALGGCAGDIGNGGDDPVLHPRGGSARPAGPGAARPAGAPRPGAPGEPAMITLYLMRLPLGAGFDPFPSGGTSWVARGASATVEASAMLAALAARARVPAVRAPVIEESSLMAPDGFAVALSADDGEGYAMRMSAAGGGTRVRVCGLRGGRADGTLAEATLADGDLLCVRVRGGGRDYALALTPRLVAAGTPSAVDALREERRRFEAEAGPLTTRSRDDGVRFRLAELAGGMCP
jgi:hypothetical protein